MESKHTDTLAMRVPRQNLATMAARRSAPGTGGVKKPTKMSPQDLGFLGGACRPSNPCLHHEYIHSSS